MRVHEIEKLTARKMSLREKLGWFMLKKQLRKNPGAAIDIEKSKKLGRLALIFGISTWALALIPVISVLSPFLAVAAIICGILSLNGNNNTQGLIGLLLGSIFLLIIILVIAIIAGGGF